MKKVLIAAVSKNYVLGNKGKVPWHSAEELKHFKSSTTGYPIIMGRKTWEGIGKPLNERLNVVVSKKKITEKIPDGIKLASSLEEAFNFCEKLLFNKIFIIGGGEIFRQTIDISDEIILSIMNFEVEGDVYFPEIDPKIWKELSYEIFTDFTVHYYIRV